MCVSSLYQGMRVLALAASVHAFDVDPCRR